MIPKTHRVRKTREFERVFSSRQSVYGRFVRISYIYGVVNITRCAVVISTKVSKKAVIRNKIKRRVRIIITRLLPELLPPLDLVIVCLPTSIEANIKEFEEDIRKTLEKVYKKVS
jgi:ribonuclease P protein component